MGSESTWPSRLLGQRLSYSGFARTALSLQGLVGQAVPHELGSIPMMGAWLFKYGWRCSASLLSETGTSMSQRVSIGRTSQCFDCQKSLNYPLSIGPRRYGYNITFLYIVFYSTMLLGICKFLFNCHCWHASCAVVVPITAGQHRLDTDRRIGSTRHPRRGKTAKRREYNEEGFYTG